MSRIDELMLCALKARTAIPGFNIPYLPMMAPVARALRDTRCFGLIMALHLDHVPVIDEDDLRVDYEAILREAVALGYDSVMVDGSRLSLEDNIAATVRVVDLAHASGVAVEAELGAVMGHESGPMPPYEELFASGRGFTDPDEARRFIAATGVDWLSVAVGSVHGAISAAKRREKKLEARLSIERIDALQKAVGVPLVLHGGTGIKKRYVLEAMRHGIAKINVATAIRQPYEALVEQSPEAALEAVYEATVSVIRDELELAGTADLLMKPS